MTASELRQKYLEFFKEKGHVIIPSASLIPENDPSVLFTTAGMHPLVPFLMGEKHPAGKRLVSCQKCIRTGDIDEVGDNFHLTFFEMLGNWSLGDYWKKEAIEWSYEFLTAQKWLGLDPEKLAISVFSGDNDCPFDQESYDLWRSLGVSKERIIRLGNHDNWWPADGKSIGPQGPDTEMFYWTGEGRAPTEFDPEDSRWFEIWNDVFMEYERTADGKHRHLKQKNVDTGMGLERTVAVLQGKSSVYETELFLPLMKQIKSVAQEYNEVSARIIADHLRAAIFIMADNAGIVPSNLKQGYVVRKLIRRAIRHLRKIGVPSDNDIFDKFVILLAEQFKDIYQEIVQNQAKVLQALNQEKHCFEMTLEKGLKIFQQFSNQSEISGVQAFDLYSTYGFPLEMTKELAKEQGIAVDEAGFQKEFQKHQELSRTASAGEFKGGLVSQSEMTIKYHTATHLLHQALRQVLGNHVEQRGSNITDERLRFDFSYPEKMTAEQIKKVEDIVNQKIKEDLVVCREEMSVEEAKKKGAIGLFGNKYGERVKVYTIGDPSAGSGSPFSREICGGPHITRTSELGHFKIIKEEASAKGIRRVKAILE